MLVKSNRYMREANLIGGEWIAADNGATIEVNNPANGQGCQQQGCNGSPQPGVPVQSVLLLVVPGLLARRKMDQL